MSVCQLQTVPTTRKKLLFCRFCVRLWGLDDPTSGTSLNIQYFAWRDWHFLCWSEYWVPVVWLRWVDPREQCLQHTKCCDRRVLQLSLAVTEAFTRFAKPPSELLPTAAFHKHCKNVCGCFLLADSRQQPVLSQHLARTARHWLTPLWAAATVLLLVGNFYNFIH